MFFKDWAGETKAGIDDVLRIERNIKEIASKDTIIAGLKRFDDGLEVDALQGSTVVDGHSFDSMFATPQVSVEGQVISFSASDQNARVLSTDTGFSQNEAPDLLLKFSGFQDYPVSGFATTGLMYTRYGNDAVNDIKKQLIINFGGGRINSFGGRVRIYIGGSLVYNEYHSEFDEDWPNPNLKNLYFYFADALTSNIEITFTKTQSQDLVIPRVRLRRAPYPIIENTKIKLYATDFSEPQQRQMTLEDYEKNRIG